MADDINVKVKLDGEAEFKNGMRNLAAASKENKSALELLDAQYGKTEKSMEGLEKESGALQRSIDTQEQIISRLSERIQKASEAYGSSSTNVAKLKDEQNKAQIELIGFNQALEANQNALNNAADSAKFAAEGQDALEAAIRRINEEQKLANQQWEKYTVEQEAASESTRNFNKDAALLANNLDSVALSSEELDAKIDQITNDLFKGKDSASAFSFDIEKLAQSLGIKLPPAIKDAMSQTGDLGEKISGLAKKFGIELDPELLKSISGFNGLSAAMIAAATATVIIIKKLTELSVAAAKNADDIIKNATVMGVTNQEYQRFVYLADLVGTSADTIGTSMSRLTRNMSRARDGTKTTQVAFKKLGVAWKDSATGELRDVNTVFSESIDALGKVENATERDAIALELFGRQARELNPLIAAGSEKLNRFAKEADNVGYVMGDKTLGSLKMLADELTRFDRISEGFQDNLGQIASPAVTKSMETINSLLAQLSTGVRDSGLIEVLSTSFSILGDLVSIGGSTLSPLLDGVFSALKLIMGALTPTLAMIEMITTTIANLAKLLSGGVGLKDFSQNMDTAFNTMLEKLGVVKKDAESTFDSVGTSSGKAAGAIKDSFLDAYKAIAEEADKTTYTAEEANEAIKKRAEELATEAKRRYTLVEDESGRLHKVQLKEYALYEEMKTYIDEYYGDLSESQKVYMARYIHNNDELYARVKSKIEGSVEDTIKGAEKTAKENSNNIGTAVAGGLVNGMLLGIPSIVKTVKMVVDAIKNAFTGTQGLDINSPSRLSDKWGQQTMQGYINGFNKLGSQLQNSINSALDTVGQLRVSGSTSTSTAYNDYSSLTVYANDSGIMAEIEDWWQNKQRRARAAGVEV